MGFAIFDNSKANEVGATPFAQAPHTPCFTAGTEICTRRGPVLIEDLRRDDKILTRDNGYRTLRWIGARRFTVAMLNHFPELLPVRVKAGALGPGLPQQDSLVSPQHRLLLSGPEAETFSGEREVLVSAADLAVMGRATREPMGEVTYYHIMFDAHEIVCADGCWSESFLPDAAAMDGLHSAQRDEILTIFPELEGETGGRETEVARAIFVPGKSAFGLGNRA